MRGRFGRLVFLVLAVAISGRVDAMNSTGRCKVVAGERLPAASGGAEALCSEVEREIAVVASNAAYKAEIHVLSPSRLAATLVVNGRALPEQKFSITDRDLNRPAIKRFAQALAAEVAKPAKP